jgi:hypothetical protein
MRLRTVQVMLLLVLLASALSVLPALAQGESPNVFITEPAPMATVSGIVPVTGTVNPPGLGFYFLEIAPFLSDPATAEWMPVTLPSTAPVENGLLGQWNTATTADGAYALRLHAFLSDGTEAVYLQRPVRVANAGAPAATAAPAVPDEPEVVPRPRTVNELPLPVGGHMDQMDPGAAEMIEEAGLTWMKWQVRFVIGDDSLINVIRDRINFSHERGFYAMISIPGMKEELSSLGMAEYAPLYADFMTRVAALQPDAIQVWNEQNIDREWPVGMISGAQYVALLRPAYEAIKAADPEIKVITGAPAPTGFFGGCGQGGCDDDVFYQQMANAGAANYTDCIGVHYNEGILPPTAIGGDPRGEYPTRYLPLMIQRAAFPFRANAEPLCFSELGYLTSDGFGALPAPFAWAANTSIEEHAEWLRDAIVVAANSQDAQVDLLIIFNVDFDRFVDDDPQGGFAMIRPDGTCPSCQTIATLRVPQPQ